MTMRMLVGTCIGGPLHGQSRAVMSDQYDIRAMFIEPAEVRWMSENEPITPSMGELYECVYSRGRRIGENEYEYVFSRITPTAGVALRRKIRKEELAHMQEQIDSLTKANYELRLRLDECEEDLR